MFCGIQAKIDKDMKARGWLSVRQLPGVISASFMCLTQNRTAFHHCLRANGQSSACLQASSEEVRKMSNKPADWDEAKIKRVINHYESQSEDEAVAEDEAAFAVEQTLVQVPTDLVPAVRAFIAKQQAKQ
jgi:type II secretory pathway component PulC